MVIFDKEFNMIFSRKTELVFSCKTNSRNICFIYNIEKKTYLHTDGCIFIFIFFSFTSNNKVLAITDWIKHEINIFLMQH